MIKRSFSSANKRRALDHSEVMLDEFNLIHSNVRTAGASWGWGEGGRGLPHMDVKPWNQDWLIAAGVYPGRDAVVHCRLLSRNFLGSAQQFAGTFLYTWVERGTVRVNCLAQEHNTMSPARARTRTARSRVERTNHEATAPPFLIWAMYRNVWPRYRVWFFKRLVIDRVCFFTLV